MQGKMQQGDSVLTSDASTAGRIQLISGLVDRLGIEVPSAPLPPPPFSAPVLMASTSSTTGAGLTPKSKSKGLEQPVFASALAITTTPTRCKSARLNRLERQNEILRPTESRLYSLFTFSPFSPTSTTCTDREKPVFSSDGEMDEAVGDDDEEDVEDEDNKEITNVFEEVAEGTGRLFERNEHGIRNRTEMSIEGVAIRKNVANTYGLSNRDDGTNTASAGIFTPRPGIICAQATKRDATTVNASLNAFADVSTVGGDGSSGIFPLEEASVSQATMIDYSTWQLSDERSHGLEAREERLYQSLVTITRAAIDAAVKTKGREIN
ncbi:unnamed protein product [Protopolystoma xenopodis]|uniref:Uncharacterized protein n=1 Tax=Protopolystoma xenopodis TaxID=117903 RepID=A0A448WXL6_9PLAT|nr:unnamed protein product [Protopolystoma xenopodis]